MMLWYVYFVSYVAYTIFAFVLVVLFISLVVSDCYAGVTRRFEDKAQHR